MLAEAISLDGRAVTVLIVIGALVLIAMLALASLWVVGLVLLFRSARRTNSEHAKYVASGGAALGVLGLLVPGSAQRFAAAAMFSLAAAYGLGLCFPVRAREAGPSEPAPPSGPSLPPGP